MTPLSGNAKGSSSRSDSNSKVPGPKRACMCAVPFPSLLSSPPPLYPLPPPHSPPYTPLSTFASYGFSSIKDTLSPQDLCIYYSLCLKCSFLNMHCLLTSFAILSPSSHTVINCNSLFTQQSLPCSIFSTELCHHLTCYIYIFF